MHLRRAVLLFAIVLGLTAVAASLAPPQRQAAAPQPAPVLAAPSTAATSPRTVRLTAQPGRRLPVLAVRTGEHVLVIVDSSSAGQVSLPGLGRISDIEPGTPAGFDLFVPQSGRYAVQFIPPLGEPSRIATLVAG